MLSPQKPQYFGLIELSFLRTDWEPPDKKVDTRKYRAEPRSIYDYQPGKSSVLNNEKMVMFDLSYFVALTCNYEILSKCLCGSIWMGFLMLTLQCSCGIFENSSA